jgi:hypothetical protein
MSYDENDDLAFMQHMRERAIDALYTVALLGAMVGFVVFV